MRSRSERTPECERGGRTGGWRYRLCVVASLIWISGASSGIGLALARAVPWADARVIGISRRPPPGVEHLAVDLSDASTWDLVGASFGRELTGAPLDRVAFIHAAGTIEPIGYAGEVDPAAYATNVVLNSAAPQVLGHLFLAAVRQVEARRHLVMLTSGAASSVYAGWSSYGAGKAAVDQWVRNVGAEQAQRGAVQVLAIAPGTVDTNMQAQIRATDDPDFPQRQKFLDLHRDGRLASADDVARRIWALLDDDLETGSVIDLRRLSPP